MVWGERVGERSGELTELRRNNGWGGWTFAKTRVGNEVDFINPLSGRKGGDASTNMQQGTKSED